jgi:Protein of unknown function (DUF2652)
VKTNVKPDGRGVREGYLVLADISGYTEFLTGTELERLVELIEACYFDFSSRLLDMTRATTCRCAACGSIGSLGLKFVSHYGGYLVERDAGREDLAGPDVILVHRLLKNTIIEAGGPQAYAFFTEACLQRLPPQFNLPSHGEVYESFGETTGGVHDLAPVLSAMREERRLYIGAGDADFEATFDVPIAPALAWQYVVDPIERQRWACNQYDKNPDRDEPNARGRLGAGAKSHCGHGPGPIEAFREFVDWRPFAYFTARTRTPLAGGFVMARPVIETIEFTPLEDQGTRIVIRYREISRNPVLRVVSRVIHPFLSAFWRQRAAELDRVVKEDVARPGFDVEQPEAASVPDA